MSMRIRTKWGQILIDPERIYEINVKINPWENINRIVITLEGNYEQIPVDLESISQLITTLNRLENELSFVRLYKYKDHNGQLQIDEPRRLSAIRERKK